MTPVTAPHSPWRPPKALQRYCWRSEAQLLDHYGYRDRPAQAIGRRINAVTVLHNRAALWQLALLLMPTNRSQSTLQLVEALAIALRNADIGIEHATEALRDYERRRQRPVGMRAEDYQNLRGDDGRRLRPSEKPLGDIRGFRLYCKRAYKLWRGAGRPVTVTITIPKKRRRLATNAITWYSTEYVASGKRSHHPGDAGFEHVHYIGISIPAIWKARCSNFKRIKGRPAYVHGNSIAWLGPHYKAIEAARNQRQAEATEQDKDPVVWLDADGNPLKHATHKKRLRRATGLLDVQPSKLIETGNASLAARGATPEYLAQTQGVQSKDAVDRFEDFTERVLNAVAEGIDLGIGKADNGGTMPGILTCEVCGYEQEAGATLCGNPACKAPLGSKADDRLERRRAELHRLIDDILFVRGESEDDRERLGDDEEDEEAGDD